MPPGLQSPWAPSPSALTYTPLAPGATTPNLNAARMVLTHLDACYASRAANPYWFTPFWNAVSSRNQGGLITPDVHGILAFNGFARGAHPPPVPPRVPELNQHLHQLNSFQLRLMARGFQRPSKTPPVVTGFGGTRPCLPISNAQPRRPTDLYAHKGVHQYGTGCWPTSLATNPVTSGKTFGR